MFEDHSKKYNWYMNARSIATLVGYKGTTKTDTAAFYAPYIPIMRVK